MNNIQNLEQLRAERERLKANLSKVEAEIRADVDYLNSCFQPIFKFAGYVKNTILPFTGGVSKFVLPLLAGGLSTKAKGGAKKSVLAFATTLAAEYLISKTNLSAIGGKLMSFISGQKRKNNDIDDNYE